VRIAQLANFYGPASGGLRTAVDALGRGYVEAGHERALLVPGPDDSWTEDERGITVTFRAPTLLGESYRMVLQPWKVREALDRIRPTNVEVSDKTTMVTAAGWARRRGAGSVLLSHERLDTHLGPRITWRGGLVRGVNAVNRLLLRKFDEVVVTSAFAADEFARVATRGVHRIPLGVDLTTFHPDYADHPGGGLPRLIYIGRLSEEKSPALAVATAVELHRQGFEFRLDVYGDGPDKEELVALAADAPIVFHPYMSDRRELAARLASADVALSVCPVETFGLAILEALASGTPVVTADRGGGRELVTADSGAWAAPDPVALAGAVRRVLDRPRSERRGGARRQAERYPWSATVGSMLDVHTMTRDRLVRA
jgi:alpha-1,6-mannosyltransferase